jgi:hypothetical protein
MGGLMGLNVRTTCSIEYAPAITTTQQNGKKTRVVELKSRGRVEVTEGGLTILPGHSGYSTCALVDPGEIDGLISALIEARAVGRHLYGHKGDD